MRLLGRFCFIKQILLVLGMCLFFLPFAKSQLIREVHVSGGSVQFIYSTLDQYKDGISLVPTTTLSLRMRDIGTTQWQLIAYALDNTIAYEGDVANDIPLTDLKLRISASDGTPIAGQFDLPSVDSLVILDGAGGPFPVVKNVTVTISYQLPGMMNKPEGMYFVALYFKLRTY
jgi:hypothetical protein